MRLGNGDLARPGRVDERQDATRGSGTSLSARVFALMGVMYFLTTYLQSVLGYSPLQAGVKMLPIAIGMVLASKLAVGLTRRLGTKFSVALGLATVAAALAMIPMFDTDTSSLDIAMALGTLGLGMGFAMSPATEAIMGALPRAKAGIGSAMNDVVREVGAQLGGGAGTKLIDTANSAFVDAMTTTATPAAAAAVTGALIALAFLPSRARAESPAPLGIELLEPVTA
jgi:MFS transporter, DHA2 family, multidrug resistance protein